MKKKNIFRKLSPLNEDDEISTLEYVIKKLLAFFMIYALAAVIGEAVIIGILYLMGCQPLQGIMPTGKVGILLPYYGFCVFLLVTILYCRFIEKRNFASMGFQKRFSDFFVGGMLAVALLLVIIVLCCILDSMKYVGINDGIDGKYLMALLIGFCIQSIAEETLCRGFLMNSLLRKTSVPAAVLVSATAFAMPHFFTLFELEIQYVIVGIVNLYLISVIFSLLVLYRSNIWISCGLHCTWNFILYGVLGLAVSGSNTYLEGVLLFEVNSLNLINGGVYGIESGISTTVVLVIVMILMIKFGYERNCKHGI